MASLITEEQLREAGLSPTSLFANLRSSQYRTILGEVAKRSRAAAPLRHLFGQLAEVRDGRRNPEPGDFGSLSDYTWARLIVGLARDGQQEIAEVSRALEVELRKRADAERAEMMKPHRLKTDNVARTILEKFDPESRLDTRLGVVTGGMRLNNLKGEVLFVLRASSPYVVFQNEADGGVYVQYASGFASDILFAVLTDVARRTAGIRVLSGIMIDFVCALFPPARYAVLAATVLRAAATVATHWDALRAAYDAIIRTAAWVEAHYPGLLLTLLRGVGAQTDLLQPGLSLQQWVQVIGRMLAGGGAARGAAGYVDALAKSSLGAALRVIRGMLTSGAVGLIYTPITVNRERARERLLHGLAGVGLANAAKVADILEANPDLKDMLEAQLESLAVSLEEALSLLATVADGVRP